MTTIHDTAGGARGVTALIARAVNILMAAACLTALMAAAGPSAAHADSAVSVLCYHSFIEKKKMDPYCFTVDELNSHIMQLKKEGFKFVSVNDVIGGRITGTKNVLISVDDGNRSVYEAYHKVFRPNGIRPLLAIYPNIIINKKKYALTWEQLSELANGGCDIAAHGYFHLKINRKLNDKNPGYFKKEIFLSKKVLEEKLGRTISIFVYPFGLRDDLTIRTLKEAGYRYAFTIDRGRLDVPLAGSGEKPYELPRYMVTRTSWNYCLDRVMKNARPKVAYRVAAADDSRKNAIDAAAPKRTNAARHDPAENLYAGIVEGMSAVSPHDAKREKKEKREKSPRSKKKIGKTADFISDDLLIKESAAFQTTNDGGATIASPIQRVASSVRRDELVFNSHDMTAVSDAPISGTQVKSPEAAGQDEPASVLKGKVERSGGGYYAKMKNRYNDITRESLHAYHVFLGMIRGKIDRIKLTIRKYVVTNF